MTFYLFLLCSSSFFKEMNSIEKHPDFDKSIKSDLKAATSTKAKVKKDASGGDNGAGATCGADAVDDGEDSFGLGLFAAAEKEGSSKPKVCMFKNFFLAFSCFVVTCGIPSVESFKPKVLSGFFFLISILFYVFQIF